VRVSFSRIVILVDSGGLTTLDLSLMEQTLSLLAILDQASHVPLHLLNLRQQANEVVLDSVEEISE